MSRTRLNQILIACIACLAVLAWFLRRDVTQPNYLFIPEMVSSIPYDSFTENPNYANNQTQQLPVAGAVARGSTFLDYQATKEDALRAAGEDGLKNPWNEDEVDADALLAAKSRGRKLYSTYCLPCHGALGDAQGPVAKHGFFGVTPFNTETSLNMTDGQMFHIVTFGQRFIEAPQKKFMPAYAAQISEEDRWKVILHVRALQEPTRRQLEAEPDQSEN
jgi:mono/diheme cytochrome c family protein